jgi:hypothetical protein
VVVADYGRVERDDAQAVDVVDPVLRLIRSGLIEQEARVRDALVVVAHDPDDRRSHALSNRLDDSAQSRVRVRLAKVGEVAGEHDRLRLRTGALELV